MQSVPITTNVVSSISVSGRVYSIEFYVIKKFHEEMVEYRNMTYSFVRPLIVQNELNTQLVLRAGCIRLPRVQRVSCSLHTKDNLCHFLVSNILLEEVIGYPLQGMWQSKSPPIGPLECQLFNYQYMICFKTCSCHNYS